MSQDRIVWLLDQLQAEGARITPRERIALAQAVEALTPDDDELATMVASLVTHREEDWRRVYARAAALLPTWRPTQAPPKSPRLEGLRGSLGLTLSAIVVLFALGWGVTRDAGEAPSAPAGSMDSPQHDTAETCFSFPNDDPTPDDAASEMTCDVPAPTDPCTHVAPARASPVRVSPEMITPPRSALATALTLTLLALGLTLFVAPTSHTRRVLEQLRASRAQADGLYHAGRRGVLSLQIPQGESLGREAVLSAATSLGRQALEHRSPLSAVPRGRYSINPATWQACSPTSKPMMYCLSMKFTV